MKPFGVLALGLLAACSPATSRPAIMPMPEARRGEVELEVPAATQRLAASLTSAGYPVSRVSPRDGYIETRWFDATTGQRIRGRPLGTDDVRVRAWVTPSRRGYSEMVVEAVYRPFADPSRPPRDLEQSVPYTHPVRLRIRELFDALGAGVAVGEPDALAIDQPRPLRPGIAAGVPAADTARVLAPDSTPAADTAKAADSLSPAVARADTVRAAAPPPVVRDTTRPLVTRPQPLPIPPRERPAVPAQPATGFSVQVAATTERVVADTAASRLREFGYQARIVSEGTLLKVRTTRFATRAAAQAAQRRLRPTFPDAFLVDR